MDKTEEEINKKTDDSFNFWFTNSGKDFHNHGFQSKSCDLFKYIVPTLQLPTAGAIMQLGTNLGIGFDILYQQYPYRAVGIDLWNPLDHPGILEQDMYDVYDVPLAFCNVDMGDFRWTPKLRLYALDYAIRNAEPGSYIITAGGQYVNDCLDTNLDELFNSNGFTISNYSNFVSNTLPNIEHEIIAFKNLV
jgi:hypothetical protein